MLGHMGRLTLVLSVILSAVCAGLALIHVVAWAVFAYGWLVVIGLFSIEVILHRWLRDASGSRMDGPSFAALCALMSASLAAWVLLRITTTFTGGVLPWDTTAYLFPVSGEVGSQSLSSLHIRVVNADVEVTGQSTPFITYHGLMSVRSDSTPRAEKILNEAWQVGRRGNSYNIQLDTRQSPFAFSTRLTEKGTLMVQVPSQLQLSVETVNGNLSVNRMVHGVKLSTLNGSIELSNVHGNVLATTLSGQINVHHVRGQTTLKTTNGDVSLTDVGPDGQVKDVNGSILASFPAPVHDWTLSTVNGQVRLTLPKRTNNVLVHAVGPHIDWANGKWHFVGTRSPHDQTARIGRGWHSIALSTAAGHIHIRVDAKH